jgi:hypothetical protein
LERLSAALFSFSSVQLLCVGLVGTWFYSYGLNSLLIWAGAYVCFQILLAWNGQELLNEGVSFRVAGMASV